MADVRYERVCSSIANGLFAHIIDCRTFMNLSSVREQVEMFKDYPNMLLWYTGDE